MTLKTYLYYSWFILPLLAVMTRGAAPEFGNLPIDINVGEDESNERLLLPLDVTDSDGDSVVCTLDISAKKYDPSGDEFILIKNPSTGNYELNVGENAFLEQEELYYCDIECTDGTQTAKSTIYVHVIPGQDISWTFPVTVSTNGIGTTAGDVIYTAEASNTLNDNDPLTHQMSYYLVDVRASPSSFLGTDPFFQVDPESGEIVALQNLERIPADVSEVYIDIRATDEELTLYGTVVLRLRKQNTRPSTTVLPLTQALPETTAAGTTLFTLDVVDPDDQVYTTTWSCEPPAGNTIFTLDAGNRFKIAPGQKLNYESTNNAIFECSFIINDGIHASDTYVYQLNVTDVNDPPEFSTSMYHVTIEEGAAGSVSASPGFTCTDEDAVSGDEPLTYRFKPDLMSSRFDIDSSGNITFAVDYDVDDGNMPTEVVLTVYCIDDGGGTATSRITITIKDKNDNTPYLQNTVTMYSDNNMKPGVSLVGSLRPIDQDSGSNGDVSCTATSSSQRGAYYTVTTTCDVYVARTLNFDDGTVVSYVVNAVDHGDPQLTGTTTLSVIYREVVKTTTTAAPTTTPYDFWDYPENKALFAMALLFGLTILGLILYGCIRYCLARGVCDKMYRGCKNHFYKKRYPPRGATPVTPPRANTPLRREVTPIIIREGLPPPRILQAVPQPQPLLRTVVPPSVAPGFRRIGPIGPGLAATLRPPPPYAL